ncbi:protein eyes shut homolog isoform X3 [Ruditapes philippinarum]|uniref:protein eyes shut homolog isoform X3 n=1 Tax=Ruditapes philippinarum TaxID=129788 RepID=UPI00295A98FD|nr:protein eyes shut homolog isoform X3 [Ruditapes philippinarum]
MLNMSEQIQILALAVIVVHFVISNGINVIKNATTVYLSSTTDGNECMPQPCLNGGSCIDGTGDFTCLCRPDFAGNICEIEINRCKYGNVCYNGGTCTEETYPYNCQCPAGFSGSSCEIDTIRVFYLATAGIGDAGTYICKSSESESEEYFNVEIVWSSVICTFENQGLCQWENKLYGYPHVDYIPWKLEHGRLEDHSLGTKNGTYLTIQSKTRVRSELHSPILPANQTICFEFWYRISINGSGTVSMALLEDQCRDKRTEMFKATDTRRGHWVRAAVTILNTLVPNDYNVVIAASKVLGSIDIDDLKFSNKHCQGFQGIVGKYRIVHVFVD